MLACSLMIHRDYEVLHTIRSSADEQCHHPRCELGTLLRVQNNQLPIYPRVMYENPLPANRAVPEPLILTYFPTFVRGLPLLDRADYHICHEYALLLEIVCILRGALEAYYH